MDGLYDSKSQGGTTMAGLEEWVAGIIVNSFCYLGNMKSEVCMEEIQGIAPFPD